MTEQLKKTNKLSVYNVVFSRNTSLQKRHISKTRHMTPPLEMHLHLFTPACGVGLPLYVHICQCTEDICIDWSRACLHGKATVTSSSMSIKSNSLWWNTPPRLDHRCCCNKSSLVVTRPVWYEVRSWAAHEFLDYNHSDLKRCPWNGISPPFI